MGSFDWGSTLRRTVGAQQTSASNEYKLLKMFNNSNELLKKQFHLYLRECQKLYGNDKILKTIFFCYQVGSYLFEQKLLTLCEIGPKFICCQKNK